MFLDVLSSILFRVNYQEWKKDYTKTISESVTSCLERLSFGYFRWKTGEWTDCSKTCNDGHPGERTREVICTDESHDIEVEVEESYCVGPKPSARETCAVQSCPAEWVTVKSGSVSLSLKGAVSRGTSPF